jgi:hypothetical protein
MNPFTKWLIIPPLEGRMRAANQHGETGHWFAFLESIHFGILSKMPHTNIKRRSVYYIKGGLFSCLGCCTSESIINLFVVAASENWVIIKIERKICECVPFKWQLPSVGSELFTARIIFLLYDGILTRAFTNECSFLGTKLFRSQLGRAEFDWQGLYVRIVSVKSHEMAALKFSLALEQTFLVDTRQKLRFSFFLMMRI